MSTRFKRPSETLEQALERALRLHTVIARTGDAKISFTARGSTRKGRQAAIDYLENINHEHRPEWLVLVGDKEIPL